MGSGRGIRAILTKRACVRLTLLLALLVGGAIVNVAVAWACVTQCDSELLDTSAIMAKALNRLPPNCECHGSDVAVERSYVIEDIGVRIHIADLLCLESGPCISYSYSRFAQGTVTAGLPFRGLQGSVIVSDGEWKRYGCIQTPFHEPLSFLANTAGWHDLPLTPVGPATLLNSVFYAVILWLLFAAPFALQRRRRITRGLCVKCAYDLRGRAPMSDVCPECGAAREVKS